jgi:hypothetical protein
MLTTLHIIDRKNIFHKFRTYIGLTLDLCSTNNRIRAKSEYYPNLMP